MILCVDLDDTLLKKDKSISTFTLKSLKRWKEEGNIIIINTARPLNRCIDYFNIINADYLICNAGADIYDSNLNIIRYIYTSKEETNKIVRSCLSYCNLIRIQTLDKLFTTCIEDVSEYSVFSDFYEFDATKIIIYKGEHEKILEKLKSLNVYYVLYGKGTWARISPIGATKKEALKFILHILNVSNDYVYGFGDDYGDVDFILDCGHGYLMENALTSIKKEYEYIKRCKSNEEDGIALVINEVLDRRN